MVGILVGLSSPTPGPFLETEPHRIFQQTTRALTGDMEQRMEPQVLDLGGSHLALLALFSLFAECWLCFSP